MTKRFTPKASDYTQRLADLQADKAALVKRLRQIEAEEVALKAFLMPFYNEGLTDVEYGDHSLRLNYTTQQREYLDQDKAIALLTKAGKKVPYFTTNVTTFKVKALKN